MDESQANLQISNEPPLTESIAISSPDLAKTLAAIDPYTPAISENPEQVAGEFTGKVALAMVNGDFLIKPHILGEQSDVVTSPGGFKYYVVKNGENISTISQLFNISPDTIKIANNISDPNLIKPGMRLLIPPASGIVYTVVKGDNVSDIVVKYQGDLAATIKINNLSTNSQIFAGQRLIIVGGHVPTPIASKPVAVAKTTTSTPSVSRGTCANRFPFGWCTWYVASRRCVPWSGNAGAWPRNAQALGYRVGRTPIVGAILVTHESWWGHVAYVEAVNGGTITVSEMNFVRWGKVSRRTLPANYGVYIY
jgi:surface antigen